MTTISAPRWASLSSDQAICETRGDAGVPPNGMTTERRPPKMHADEIELDDALVRRLLVEQFAQWSDLPLQRIPDSGTDSAIYRLGDDMGLRLPRIHWAVAQIDKEVGWLGRLAGHLPVPVPVPLGRGEPGHGYPYPWLVYPWVPGVSLDRIAATPPLVVDVASFVLALQEIPTEGGPAPGRRGGPMAPRDREVEWALQKLEGVVDTVRARDVWQAALRAESSARNDVWVHGDLLPGNILVAEDRLAGVIDWSATGVGDPACDAMFAWSLGAEDRALYRRLLGYDDATWARARGWVVEQAVLYIPYYAQSLPMAVAQATTRLEAALSDGP
jgi:aminoglycoside phosphotransferase (APT) family kinase protein